MILRFSSVLFALLTVFISNAQENFKEQERSATIIQRGIQLHDEEKYDEALAEFKKVHRNDSNYYLAGAEILNTYLTTKKYKEGNEFCDELLKIKNDYTPNILIFKGDFQDHLGLIAEAEKTYLKGAAEYPLNHSFFFELGVSKMKQKKYDEAYALFIKTLRLNPFHAPSHQQLGLLAYRNNNITCTVLAFQFYLICDATSQRARNIVIDFEKIAKMELEVDTLNPVKVFQEESDFSDIESILKSKVALGPKYKARTDLSFDLVKQMQVVIENIGKYPEVKGFYNEFYGKFFTQLNKEKFFEPYVYYCLRGMEVEQVNKWLTKNKSDVDKFENWAYIHICENYANYPETLNGKVVSVPHWFSNNRIVGAGSRNAQKNNEGYWNFYYGNGIKKSEGTFVNGDKDKLWKFYYATGELEEEMVYNKGVEISYNSYYVNTNPRVQLAVAAGKIEGPRKIYFSNGNPSSVTEFKGGVINGTETYYYRNGALRYSINNTNGDLNGDLVEYFDNKKIYQKVTFVNGKREGASKTFYNNTNNSLETEGNYVKGKATGEWKSYFRSGKLYRKENYNSDGLYDGLIIEYFDNGKVASEELYSNGKMNGLSKYFTEEGVLWQEFLYKKGKLIEYRAFKPDGSKICDSKINGKNFELTLYHPNGTKRREGKVSDGELEGPWKDYSTYGVLIRDVNYKEGRFDGKYIDYHVNGKVQKERTYKNGMENGYQKSYNINGALDAEGMVIDDDRQGYWNYYYRDGSLKNRLYYYNNAVDGWYEYYDVNGKMSGEDLYREGCLVKVIYHDTSGAVLQNIDLPGGTGWLVKKDASGKTTFKKEFVKDLSQGASIEYYPDGKVRSQVTYKDGKKEGKLVIYTPLSTLESDISYYNDNKSGKELYYDLDNKLLSDYSYENDDINGTCFNYFTNGKVHKDIRYDYGDTEGESNLYDEFGELIYKRNFHRDLLVSYTYKGPDGKLLAPIEPKKGESTIVCYFQNGKKSFEAGYSNGDLHGRRTIYNSNGKVLEDDYFYFGYQNGEAKTYFSNGNLKELEHFVYGRLDGKSETFYENGKPRLVGYYKKGQEHGVFKYFDATGKLIKTVIYYNGDPITIL